ncbi:MAG: hypothetical protein F4Y80_12225, partial [Caldilineaceae bacterium SB0665_bin_21]|nr:hypothetical protein [Caldilineaceae bacterium SB0665_bin_21]
RRTGDDDGHGHGHGYGQGHGHGHDGYGQGYGHGHGYGHGSACSSAWYRGMQRMGQLPLALLRMPRPSRRPPPAGRRTGDDDGHGHGHGYGQGYGHEHGHGHGLGHAHEFLAMQRMGRLPLALLRMPRPSRHSPRVCGIMRNW